MAAISIPQKTTLAIHVQKGVSASGNPVYAYRNYTSVKPSATVENMYAVGQALAGLNMYPVSDIQRIDYANLINK